MFYMGTFHFYDRRRNGCDCKNRSFNEELQLYCNLHEPLLQPHTGALERQLHLTRKVKLISSVVDFLPIYCTFTNKLAIRLEHNHEG